MAAVLTLSDSNRGRPDPSLEETFAHDPGDRGCGGEERSREKVLKQRVREPNEMPPLNGNWLPWDKSTGGVNDS